VKKANAEQSFNSPIPSGMIKTMRQCSLHPGGSLPQESKSVKRSRDDETNLPTTSKVFSIIKLFTGIANGQQIPAFSFSQSQNEARMP
jgi:hypothetical protein